MRRRAYLAAAATTASTAVAGCSALFGYDFERADDAWASWESSNPGPGVTLYEGSASVPQGTYAEQEFGAPTTPTGAALEFETSGTAVDVMMMDRNSFSIYQNPDEGDPIQYYDALTALDSTGETLGGDLREGETHLCIDNADPWGTDANGDVEIELRLVIGAE